MKEFYPTVQKSEEIVTKDLWDTFMSSKYKVKSNAEEQTFYATVCVQKGKFTYTDV